jgi:riboflavin synthase
MFTGLVEETGRVACAETRGAGRRIIVEASTVARGVRLGDSIAVNGCCLTVAALKKSPAKRNGLVFDLLEETCRVTNLGLIAAGDAVNLERAMGAGDRFGGHFVTGHVDATGKITVWEPAGNDQRLEVECPREVRPWLVSKGSITVDGISLTVAKVTRTGFVSWIIPHTLARTNLASAKVGGRVNLEGDMIAKYVARMLSARR